MLMADVFTVTLIILGFLLAQHGLWLLSRALWPVRVARTTLRARANPVSSFLLGLPVTAGWIFLVMMVGKAFGAPGQIGAFALFILYWIYANVGTAGFVTHVGQRLSSPADDLRPWAATVRGGVATELAWLVPLVGWFGVMPVSIILGAGATTLSLFRERERQGPVGVDAGSFAQPMQVPAQPGYVLREPAEALR